MKQWYSILVIFVGIYASAHAFDEALKPLEKAIVWAQKDVVANIVKQIGTLNPEDKKHLTDLAQKWVGYRKTNVTPGDRSLMWAGAFFTGVALSPWIVYASLPLARFWVKSVAGRGGVLFAAAPLAAGWTLYWLLAGIPLIQTGWHCGNTYFIEQSARAVLKIIQNVPVPKPGEKNDYKMLVQTNGIGNEPASIKK